MDELIFVWDVFIELDGVGMLVIYFVWFYNGVMIVLLKIRKNLEVVRNGGILINVLCVFLLVVGVECVVLDCFYEYYLEFIWIMI